MSDRRRITGPENALPLVFAPAARQQDQQDQQQHKPSDSPIRPFFAKTNVVDNANGSCYLEVDNTTMIVSVYGPKPLRGSSILSAAFTVASKVSANIDDLVNLKSYKRGSKGAAASDNKDDENIIDVDSDDERSGGEYVTTGAIGKFELSSIEQKLSSYIQSAFLPSILLRKYPKSSIEVYVNILTNDSTTNNSLLSLISWCANCTALAIVDANIEVQDIVSTGNAKVSIKDSDLTIDPLYSDAATHSGQGSGTSDKSPSVHGVASFMNTSGSIVGLLIDSEDHIDEDVLDKLVKGCGTMSEEIRANINGYLFGSV